MTKRKRNNFTRALRMLGALAVWLAIVGFGPQFRMPRLAETLSVHAFQIPVQIPTKPADKQQEVPQVGGEKKLNVNLVRLYVTVRDKHGAIVTGLQKDDFKVYEDGVEQKIAFFSKDMTDPLTLAMVIDTSASQQNILDAEKETASRFLRDILKKNDLASVISVDTAVNMLADFSDDQAVLDSGIEKAEINAAPPPPDAAPAGTLLYDAIHEICTDKMPDEAGRKALVLLTDGEDQGSTTTLKGAIYAAQEANAVIHVLLMSDRGFYFQQGEFYSGSGPAHEMAEQTGGRVISVRNGTDLDKAFNEISEELRSQYIVAYYPANTAANGTYRKIKVTTKPDLRVLTREGYYAPGRAAD